MGDSHPTIPSRLYPSSHKASIANLKVFCAATITKSDYPLAASVEKNVPIYALPPELPDEESLNRLQDEWNHILLSGPGVFVVKFLYRDLNLLDRVNTVFQSTISQEAQSNSTGGGDHFSATGTNSRIWNSLQKHCALDPKSFSAYYANPWLAAISEAWLGPGYRLTTQVNIVHPSGPAQSCHRDYHLGFQSRAGVARYPRAVQEASQFLTLQGAVAHTDMPLESGPTRLLPFSQRVGDGFMSFRDPEVQRFFEENYVALPLEKGDGLFFNPALFHAAGENTTTSFSRSANLLQISSAFGKPMESVDTMALIEACWDELSSMYAEEGLSKRAVALVKAVSEGYPFPTNLDRSPPDPVSMMPISEMERVMELLERKAEKGEAMENLRQLRQARKA